MQMGEAGGRGQVMPISGYDAWTGCSPLRGYKAEFLDRQDISCLNRWGTYFIESFVLTSHGCSGSDMHYRYTCASPAQFKDCSPQGETCWCPGGLVRYGVGHDWTNTLGVSSSIHCNDNIFGDPAVGIAKKCQCSKDNDLGTNSCQTLYTGCTPLDGKTIGSNERC